MLWTMAHLRSLCTWNSPGKNTRVGSIPFFNGSSWSRDWTWVSCITGRFFTVETPGWLSVSCSVMSNSASPWTVLSGLHRCHLSWLWLFLSTTIYLFFFFIIFLFFYYFTILYWFCHTSTCIRHGCTCVPHPEPPSHLPPHTIPLGHPSAPSPSFLYPASNLDWRFISYMILYMF